MTGVELNLDGMKLVAARERRRNFIELAIVPRAVPEDAAISAFSSTVLLHRVVSDGGRAVR
jgi:hypothetical protein